MNNNTQKSGFTLAEVLITLGVIGIIAAMTLPTVINNYQKKETVTRLKKAYTIINEALMLSVNQNSEYKYWSTDMKPEDYYKQYWFPYINVMTVCDNAFKCGYKKENPWTTPDGAYTAFAKDDWRIPFLTSDGILYSISVKGGNENANNVIIIDINGKGNPNEMGKDFFILTRDKQGFINGYGYDKSSIEIDENCSKEGNRRYCAAKIIKDGWQIKDDYCCF